MVRDKNGRFIKGNSGGPGRPRKDREVEYYRILSTRCTVDDWHAIIDRAIRDAKSGDAVARRWLADYLIGPPVERKELTGAEGSALRIVIEYAKDADGNQADTSDVDA